MDVIEELTRQDDETTATQLVRILEERGYKVSKTTIVRARRFLGWTFHGSRCCQLIRSVNKEKRLQWAVKNRDNNFEDVMWTDESMIQLENHRTFSYRKVGTATNICLLNTSVNSAVYQEVLRTHLLPFLQRKLPKSRLQQDNARCHMAKATQKFLKTKKILLLTIPPESQDLNPIENVWHEMKHYIRTTAMPRNKEELLQAIQAFWATVTPEKCDRYIGHLKKVIPKVIVLNGDVTGY